MIYMRKAVRCISKQKWAINTKSSFHVKYPTIWWASDHVVGQLSAEKAVSSFGVLAEVIWLVRVTLILF